MVPKRPPVIRVTPTKVLTDAWLDGLYGAHIDFGYILSWYNLGYLKTVES